MIRSKFEAVAESDAHEVVSTESSSDSPVTDDLLRTEDFVQSLFQTRIVTAAFMKSECVPVIVTIRSRMDVFHLCLILEGTVVSFIYITKDMKDMKVRHPRYSAVLARLLLLHRTLDRILLSYWTVRTDRVGVL